jgi:hypothetical protein
MWRDEIVEEIHRIRREQAARFNYDVAAMVADAKKRQDEGGRQVVSFSQHRPQTAHTQKRG